MELLTADYILCGLGIVLALTGLFRGFSGTLAFLVALAAASAVGSFGWSWSEQLTSVAWQRAAGTLVATILAFGIVRMVVKKTVNGLLAQPTDALLGLALGVLTGALIASAWAYSGYHVEWSAIASALRDQLFGGGAHA